MFLLIGNYINLSHLSIHPTGVTEGRSGSLPQLKQLEKHMNQKTALSVLWLATNNKVCFF